MKNPDFSLKYRNKGKMIGVWAEVEARAGGEARAKKLDKPRPEKT
jgi:hypothetical protein